MIRNTRRLVPVAVLLVAANILCPGCSGKLDPKMEPGHTVRGTVKCDGEAVPYGFVLFFSHEKSMDPKAGSFVPSAVAPIDGGKYEATNVPLGHVVVVVATDPDADHGKLTRPTKLLEMIPDKAPTPEGAPPKDPLAKDPFEGKKDFVPGKDKHPPGFKAPPAPPNPATKHLSEAQKKTLREIHARYGEFGRSPLALDVKEGEQTFNIKLHK